MLYNNQVVVFMKLDYCIKRISLIAILLRWKNMRNNSATEHDTRTRIANSLLYIYFF